MLANPGRRRASLLAVAYLVLRDQGPQTAILATGGLTVAAITALALNVASVGRDRAAGRRHGGRRRDPRARLPDRAVLGGFGPDLSYHVFRRGP